MTEIAVSNGFLESARRLDTVERAHAFDFLCKFHADPRSPGIHLEKIHDNVYSARITQGLRAIVYCSGDRFALLHADQHDDAYAWANARRVEHHSVTGELQIIKRPPTIDSPRTAPVQRTNPPLFPEHKFSSAYLTSLGVPEVWLPTLRMLQSDDQHLDLIFQLPAEVAERLLDLADGKLVAPPAPLSPGSPIAASPNNLRRFWVVQQGEDLTEVLSKPLEAWMRFLHPSQRALVDGSYNGPVKVTGSAGTGKTVVAMHRARGLARKGRRVLLTSFVTALCRNLERNLRALCTTDELALITVSTVHAQAREIVARSDQQVKPINDADVEQLIKRFRTQAAPEQDDAFLWSEWREVVEAQGIDSWDAYRDADRPGRARPLTAKQRKRIWEVFALVNDDLAAGHRRTWPGLCRRALALLQQGDAESPYDAVVVDELQDLKPAEVRFLAALARNANELMLVGDAGQRIYPGGFSLRALGIDVRGRSHILKINYRTTEQIRRAADQILGETCDDFAGDLETRTGTRSLLRGPEPEFRGFATEVEQSEFVVKRIAALLSEGLQPHEIAVFARTWRAVDPLGDRLNATGISTHLLKDEGEEETASAVRLGSMHSAKGLEFKVVFAVDCSEDTVPLKSVLRRFDDPRDREAARAQERSLLYVSLTRARDEAYVVWTGRPSLFLQELAR